MALILCCSTLAAAQDVVHLKDGTKIKGAVKLIREENVDVSIDNGAETRTILKKNIKAIVYENGEVDTFEEYSDMGKVNKRLDRMEDKIDRIEPERSLISCCSIILVFGLVLIYNNNH